ASAMGAVTSALIVSGAGQAGLFMGGILWWAVGSVASMAMVGTTNAYVATLAAMVFGASVIRSLISTQTFVQLGVPDVLRGRVLSLHGLIARGSPALGALAIGYAADVVGLRLSVTTSAVAMLCLIAMLLPSARSLAKTL